MAPKDNNFKVTMSAAWCLNDNQKYFITRLIEVIVFSCANHIVYPCNIIVVALPRWVVTN